MYFFTRLAPVSRPGVFFLRLGHLRLVQVYLFYACVEIGLARLLRVYFLTRTLCIFLESAFWTAPVETKITFLLQMYFGSTCFPKVKRTFNCFKIVRVSTGFGEFNATQNCMSG